MKCSVCERVCDIKDGQTGACKRYTNDNGVIKELYPNEYLLCCPISIETMPILNFYPKNKFLQISTIGCNFSCPGCVSNIIAKEIKRDSTILKKLMPKQIVKRALKEKCKGISFIMNDPLASYFTFLEVAKEAKKEGLLVGCSTNGYFTEKALDKLIKYLDFISIGVKGLEDNSYKICGGSSFETVYRNIKKLYANNVHIEIAGIHKSTNKEELIKLAYLIKDISKDIPFQIMRFIPLEDTPISVEPTIRDSEKLVEELTEILNYVYLFNSPGTTKLNTYCPKCKEIIIKRDFYGPMGAKVKSNILKEYVCPSCGEIIRIKGKADSGSYQEADFKGGYPFTRALDMIEAMLIALNVKDRSKLMLVWSEFLKGENLKKLHHNIQQPDVYFKTIRFVAEIVDENKKAEELIKYISQKLNIIKEGLKKITTKPNVYYAMGKPLFCIEGSRMENQLVIVAGGNSVNTKTNAKGRPGMKISVEELNKLNPEYIFISSFLEESKKDFNKDCNELGIDVLATKNNKIFNHISPCFDFGSPRWILGLMFIANTIHKDVFNFDIEKEAREFYNKFYGVKYIKENINRSFAKPSIEWKWN